MFAAIEVAVEVAVNRLETFKFSVAIQPGNDVFELIEPKAEVDRLLSEGTEYACNTTWFW